jgi:hypothetical protein
VCVGAGDNGALALRTAVRGVIRWRNVAANYFYPTQANFLTSIVLYIQHGQGVRVEGVGGRRNP